jgi:DNA ligase D-like protein (predicted 3'-phosphoesterase)
MEFSDFRRTRRSGRSPEQSRGRRRGKSGPQFVIQHHAARSDHYDFRLEIDGVLVSWAIPRGTSVNQQDRRMARRTHSNGEYGAGNVIVWDHGTYANRTEYEMITCLGRGPVRGRPDVDESS